MHSDQLARVRVYANAGNPAVVSLVSRDSCEVLDVGCGAGDNAALLRRRDPWKRIDGITASPAEAELASRWMERCWVTDLELPLPVDACQRQYDVVVCSHVLEHLRDPAIVVRRLCRLLRVGGTLIIAVPNIMFWRQRWRLIVGRFEYEQTGTMDETHLRFFTYHTADRYLLANTVEMQLVQKSVVGSVPLWFLRRTLLPAQTASTIDRIACAIGPNLFGHEILLTLLKTSTAEPR